MIRLVLAAVAATAVAGCASTAAPPAADPRVAITVDDLPVHGEYPPDATPVTVTRDIVAALKAAGVAAAHGFANGHWTERGVENVKALEAWRAAGFPLANHGWSHRYLNEMDMAEFEQEVARNEPLLRRLSNGDEWRWFRYPFLDEGDTPRKRAAARAVLARRGYRVAAVTMDFSDWLWPSAYARCKSAGDDAAIARLEQSYLDAARENIAFYRSLSRSVHGRDIPYVLLLHVSSMTARMMPRLLDLYRDQGFRFVSLEEAQRDPAYADQTNPALAATPQGLEGKAAASNIPLPPRTDYAPLLEAICR